VNQAAVWVGDDGVERVAVFEPLDEGTAVSYCWRTLRKDNWCAECDRPLPTGAEAFAHDWETRWCVPCAVARFEFVYWDTPQHRKAREARDAERWRRVNEVLDG
jgi:hypothetical protein